MKIGDKLYLVCDDSRTPPCTVTIESIGRKYITTSGLHRSYSHIDIVTRRTTNSVGSKYTAYASEKAYLDHIENENVRRALQHEIKGIINNADLSTLREVLKLLKK